MSFFMLVACTMVMPSATPVVTLGPSRARTDMNTVRPPLASAPQLFPIRTPELAPGKPNPARIELRMPLGRPLCVVGDDPRSIAWLRANNQTLSRGGALCYVVNVVSSASLSQLRRAAPSVSLAPVSGLVFAQAGLQGYPAVITQSGAVK